MALREGMILFRGPPILQPCKKFKATILTIATLQVPIIPGSVFDLYLHGEEIQCKIRKIYSCSTSKSSGAAGVKRPKCIPGGANAFVQIEVESNIFIEPFTECTALGRFALRNRGHTCAVGICSKVC